MSFLVDTGAAVTLLRKDTWDDLHNESTTGLQPWTGNPLVSVDGTSLRVHGQSRINLSLGGHQYPTDVMVVSPLTTGAILGLDFLKKHGVTIDLGISQLNLRDKPPVPIYVEHRREFTVGRVSLEESIRLPPLSEQVVMGRVEGGYPVGSYLVEKTNGNALPCALARTLVNPCNGKVPIRLLNPKTEPVQVAANVQIASMELVDLPSEIVVANVLEVAKEIPDDKRKFLWSIVENSCANSQEQKEEFFALLLEYEDIFAMSSSDLGQTSKLNHHISTGSATPIRQAVRRIPPHRRTEVKSLINSMLEDEVIQPSTSPWASPIVLVRKKDNSYRFCVDYRKLNEVTHKDAYPLPRIDDTLNTLAGSKWFSTLDLLSGYWQVEVAEEDRAKTAFCTTEGLFEFRVMPFGLCNAPATFQRLMDLVLAGLQWSHCLVYLDDVIVLGTTFQEHLSNLKLVFERIREAQLKLKSSKCFFLKHKVQYLGHIVSDAGVQPDPAKIEKVATWATPRTTKEVQQFLGFAGYYRRFIQDFAKIARPLHKLTERQASFCWTTECQNAFDQLKKYLVSSPVLAYPDYSKPFILDTDASDTGIGAVLSQTDDHGREHVIAYGSRLLSKPERQYCVTRRELLAVVVFTRHFRSFLLGRPFLLRTDHGSLTWLKNFKEPEGQMARWLERLQEFDFSILHRQGKKHTNADSLSRLPCRQCGRETHGEVVTIATTQLSAVEDLRELQLSDPVIGPVFKSKLQNVHPPDSELKALSKSTRRLYQIWNQLVIHENRLYRQYQKTNNDDSVILQLIVPESKREQVLTEMHGGAMSGHLGEEKTFARICQRFYWPGYFNDVRDWCRRCADCAATKTPTPKNRAPLQSVKVGSPLQTVAVDIMGPFPESKSGNSYILVVGDYFTRWMEAYPIPNQEATTVARVLTNEFFFRFSPPEQLHSDQGKQFESQLIAEVCKILGIVKSRTTPYHPQSDGLIERFNRTLLSMLKTAAADHPFDWEDQLRPLCMAYNTSVQATTGYSPFFLMFGRSVSMPIDLMYGESPTETESRATTTTTEFACSLKHRLQEAYHRVRVQMGHQLDRQKEIYDQRVHGKPFEENDLVWLHTKVVPKGVGRKLHRPWSGPFCIIKRISNSIYRLKSLHSPRRRLVVHFDRLKPCPANIRLHDLPPVQRHSPPLPKPQTPPGTVLQMTTYDEPSPTHEPLPTHERRYPARNRQPPNRLVPIVSH